MPYLRYMDRQLSAVRLLQALFLAIALHDALQLSHPHLGAIANLGIICQDFFDELYFTLPCRLIERCGCICRPHGDDLLAALLFDADQLVPFALHGRFAHLSRQGRQRFVIRNDLCIAHLLTLFRRPVAYSMQALAVA